MKLWIYFVQVDFSLMSGFKYVKQNKKCKQTLKSVLYGLAIIKIKKKIPEGISETLHLPKSLFRFFWRQLVKFLLVFTEESFMIVFGVVV